MAKPSNNPTSESSYAMVGVPRFDARGLRRCAVPGVVVTAKGTAAADFWRLPDDTVKLRIRWMGYDWSFEARLSSGEPVPADHTSMYNFGWFVMEELYRWTTEDAADIPPFDDE